MVQIDHASMPHMQGEANEQSKELPVHTVMPPQDEAAFQNQMEQTARDFASQLPLDAPELALDEDPVIEEENKKREVFNKLVLLKEDHFKDIELAGLSFKIKLLNSSDNEYILNAVKDMPGDRLVNLSKLVLAAAIAEVNGIKFERFYTGPATIKHPILRKHHELKQYQPPVINALQKAYNDFQASVEGEYTKGFLKS